MLIIIDEKIPEQAKDRLRKYGELLELQTSGITYEAISGHPDIFFHQTADKIIVAPNLPENYLHELNRAGVEIIMGEQGVGKKYPASSSYNAVSTPGYLIHNFSNTDAVIKRLGENADLIHVEQGYTRCNLLAIDDDHFITSDEKIKKVLDRFGKESIYINPEGILLEGFRNGFFGGCCGIYERKVFIIGSLKNYPENNTVKKYLASLNLEVIELYDGPLFDGGSILFLDNH